MHRKLTVALLGLLALFATAALSAAELNPAESGNPSDPSVNQVYEAARAGHPDQARQMMNQVLANHPHSARAHYVAAELDADLKNYGEAREELQKAEDINPGLPFANAQAVAALKRQIGVAVAPATAARSAAPVLATRPARSFPWTWLWVVGGIVLVLWLVMRRRQAASYGGYPGNMPGPAMGPGSVVPPAGGFPSVMPGAGSGIVGGLASGLAVGAGIAAGEELVRHAFEPGRPGAPAEPYVGNDPPEPPPNADMGGPDFGISDGGGWDDGGSSGGDGGGGDWT